MAIFPSALLHQDEIAHGIETAAAALSSDVVRIRYEIGKDWSGDDAIFFRVLLRDSASKRSGLRAVARRASATITNEVQPGELGLQAYFNFRSESEQMALKEEGWT